MKNTLVLALLAGGLSAAAAPVTILTVPASDGFLNAKEGAPVMERVVSTMLDSEKNESHSILAGNIWRGQYKGVLEFSLPENMKPLKSAKLRLCTLDQTGCYERKEGGGPELIGFYYLTPEANGRVELGDDKIGTRLETPIFKAGDKISQGKPGFADVTAALRAAREKKSEWIGFRLEAPEAKNSAWRFVSAENQFNKEGALSPALIIEFEE